MYMRYSLHASTDLLFDHCRSEAMEEGELPAPFYEDDAEGLLHDELPYAEITNSIPQSMRSGDTVRLIAEIAALVDNLQPTAKEAFMIGARAVTVIGGHSGMPQSIDMRESRTWDQDIFQTIPVTQSTGLTAALVLYPYSTAKAVAVYQQPNSASRQSFSSSVGFLDTFTPNVVFTAFEALSQGMIFASSSQPSRQPRSDEMTEIGRNGLTQVNVKVAGTSLDKVALVGTMLATEVSAGDPRVFSDPSAMLASATHSSFSIQDVAVGDGVVARSRTRMPEANRPTNPKEEWPTSRATVSQNLLPQNTIIKPSLVTYDYGVTTPPISWQANSVPQVAQAVSGAGITFFGAQASAQPVPVAVAPATGAYWAPSSSFDNYKLPWQDPSLLPSVVIDILVPVHYIMPYDGLAAGGYGAVDQSLQKLVSVSNQPAIAFKTTNLPASSVGQAPYAVIAGSTTVGLTVPLQPWDGVNLPPSTTAAGIFTQLPSYLSLPDVLPYNFPNVNLTVQTASPYNKNTLFQVRQSRIGSAVCPPWCATITVRMVTATTDPATGNVSTKTLDQFSMVRCPVATWCQSASQTVPAYVFMQSPGGNPGFIASAEFPEWQLKSTVGTSMAAQGVYPYVPNSVQSQLGECQNMCMSASGITYGSDAVLVFQSAATSTDSAAGVAFTQGVTQGATFNSFSEGASTYTGFGGPTANPVAQTAAQQAAVLAKQAFFPLAGAGTLAQMSIDFLFSPEDVDYGTLVGFFVIFCARAPSTQAFGGSSASIWINTPIEPICIGYGGVNAVGSSTCLCNVSLALATGGTQQQGWPSFYRGGGPITDSTTPGSSVVEVPSVYPTGTHTNFQNWVNTEAVASAGANNLWAAFPALNYGTNAMLTFPFAILGAVPNSYTYTTSTTWGSGQWSQAGINAELTGPSTTYQLQGGPYGDMPMGFPGTYAAAGLDYKLQTDWPLCVPVPCNFVPTTDGLTTINSGGSQAINWFQGNGLVSGCAGAVVNNVSGVGSGWSPDHIGWPATVSASTFPCFYDCSAVQITAVRQLTPYGADTPFRNPIVTLLQQVGSGLQIVVTSKSVLQGPVRASQMTTNPGYPPTPTQALLRDLWPIFEAAEVANMLPPVMPGRVYTQLHEECEKWNEPRDVIRTWLRFMAPSPLEGGAAGFSFSNLLASARKHVLPHLSSVAQKAYAGIMPHASEFLKHNAAGAVSNALNSVLPQPTSEVARQVRDQVIHAASNAAQATANNMSGQSAPADGNLMQLAPLTTAMERAPFMTTGAGTGRFFPRPLAELGGAGTASWNPPSSHSGNTAYGSSAWNPPSSSFGPQAYGSSAEPYFARQTPQVRARENNEHVRAHLFGNELFGGPPEGFGSKRRRTHHHER